MGSVPFRLAMISDDTRGEEIFSAVRDILDSLGNGDIACSEGHFGKAAHKIYGDVLPPETTGLIERSDASLLGLIDKTGVSLGSAVGKMRRSLSLYADIRPIRAADGGFDIVFIREITEGFLADRNCFRGQPEFMPTEDMALSVRVVTRNACLKIARYAFEYAVRYHRKTIVAAHKVNVFGQSCRLFLDCFYEIAKEYPAIQSLDNYVDIVANDLVMNPQNYDVILSTNLFGDIISDVGSGLVKNFCVASNVSDSATVFMPVSHTIGPHEHNAARFFFPYLLCAAEILAFAGKTREAERLGNTLQTLRGAELSISTAAKKIKEMCR